MKYLFFLFFFLSSGVYGEKLRLAIIPFEGQRGKEITDYIIGKIRIDSYTLIEREHLSKIIKEKLFSQDVLDQDSISAYKVDVLLIGTVTSSQDGFAINYRLVSINATISNIKGNIFAKSWQKLLKSIDAEFIKHELFILEQSEISKLKNWLIGIITFLVSGIITIKFFHRKSLNLSFIKAGRDISKINIKNSTVKGCIIGQAHSVEVKNK